VTASLTDTHGTDPQQGSVVADARREGTSRCDVRRHMTGAGGRCRGQREGESGTSGRCAEARCAEVGPEVALSARFCGRWADLREKRDAKGVNVAACPRAIPGRQQILRPTSHLYTARTGKRCPCGLGTVARATPCNSQTSPMAAARHTCAMALGVPAGPVTAATRASDCHCVLTHGSWCSFMTWMFRERSVIANHSVSLAITSGSQFIFRAPQVRRAKPDRSASRFI